MNQRYQGLTDFVLALAVLSTVRGAPHIVRLPRVSPQGAFASPVGGDQISQDPSQMLGWNAAIKKGEQVMGQVKFIKKVGKRGSYRAAVMAELDANGDIIRFFSAILDEHDNIVKSFNEPAGEYALEYLNSMDIDDDPDNDPDKQPPRPLVRRMGPRR